VARKDVHIDAAANPFGPKLRELAMDIPGLIQHYGYLAVAAGTFLEGETILIMAGAAAYRGYLTLPMVIAVGTMASFVGDQIYFYLGRRYGAAILLRYPSLQSRATRANALLERHHVPLILFIRFLYGLRIAGPFVLGMSEVSWIRFLVLNFIGAVVWAALITGGGYGFGHGVGYLVGEFDTDEAWQLASVLLAGLLWWLVAWRSRAGAKAVGK
jgi:membrane protein DedA with SNARE-associated domain